MLPILPMFRRGRLVCGLSLCWLLLSLPPAAHAQRVSRDIASFGKRNVRQHGKIKWRYLSSPRTDIYYYNQNEALAEHTAHLAENALHELRETLDYASGNRFMIRVFPSADAFQNASINPDQRPEEHQHKNVLTLAYTGSLQSYYPHLKTRIARTLISDMFYGDGSRRRLQNRALLYLPDWYYEGLASYAGEGWTPRDEAILRSMREVNHSAVLRHQFNVPGKQTLQKSVWYFIDQRYGRQKLQEILYMTRLTRSVEGGLMNVLSLTEDGFTDFWEDFIDKLTADERRPMTGGLESWLSPGANERLVNAAVSPQGMVAVAVEKRGVFRLKIHDPASGRTTLTGLRWNYRSDHPATGLMDVPIAWAPDGQRLVAALPTKQAGAELVYLDRQEGKKQRIPLGNGITGVNQLAWAPDGKRLAFSASTDGQSDLFLTRAFSGGSQRLTADYFDDLHPTWSPGGDALIFASTRDTVLSPQSRKPDYKLLRQRTDLYRYDLDSQRIQRLTATPLANETQPAAIAPDSLLLLTDASGLQNIALLSLDATPAQPLILTDFDRSGAAFGLQPGKGFLLSAFDGARQEVFGQKGRPQAVGSAPEPTRWARQVAQAWEAEQAKRDSLKQAMPPPQPGADTAAAPAPDTARPGGPPAGAPNDTTDEAKEEDRPSIEYYVFDEPSESRPEQEAAQEQAERGYSSPADTASFRPFNVNEVKILDAGTYTPTMQFDALNLGIGIDPIFDFYAEAGLEMSGPHDYHHARTYFRFFQDLNSTDFSIDYRFTKHRINLGAKYDRHSRFFEDFRVIKFLTNSGDIFAEYPLNQFNRVEVSTGLDVIQREELFFAGQFEDLEGGITLGRAGLKYVLDNTRREGPFYHAGFRGELSFQNFFDFQADELAYSNLTLDLRKYTALWGGMVLATRASGGYSFGDTPARFFLGGVDEWINQDFNNPEELPTSQALFQANAVQVSTPLRGVDHNARNGTKYGLVNFELRMPLSRMWSGNLEQTRLDNFQWLFFYDLGTAWTDGSPFSQENPVNIQEVDEFPFSITVESLKSPFLQGVGTGFEAIILGAITRFQVAWGVEDGFVQDPKLYLSLGHAF